MPIIGLQQSFLHVDNGMTMEDMVACRAVADRSGEVIIFRSTGSWSMRWIARKYPTKNFHVKGKSSDWGPQAGFVPYLGIYSKVGADETKAREGTAANEDGINGKYASKVQLVLSKDELMLQCEVAAGNPPKKACVQWWPIKSSRDLLLRALRSGDDAPFLFRAVEQADRRFALYVYNGKGSGSQVQINTVQATILDKGGSFNPATAGFDKLEVMTSSEKGADNMPMTGDYDLMAVCPPWRDVNASAAAEISKDALVFTTGRAADGQVFAKGRDLDKPLDMTTNAGAVGHTRMVDGKPVKTTYAGLTKKTAGKDEHQDMGNLTGRILRCINALNAEMPNGATALRRVHHNAESHRNFIYGAISGAEMLDGDGVPLTVFQPAALRMAGKATAEYGDVATLETLAEFKRYAQLLHEAGYFVPRNWTWGMSIRDKVRQGDFAALEAVYANRPGAARAAAPRKPG